MRPEYLQEAYMKKGDESGIITSNIYDGEIYERLSPLVEKIAGVLFRRIDFDEESAKTLNGIQSSGAHLVYASFHSSNISLLILYNLLRRRGFTPPVFALEYNPFLLQSVSFVWKRIVKFFSETFLGRSYASVLDSGYVEELVTAGKSLILSLMSQRYFVKRYMEIKYDSLFHLIEVQKKMDDPILLLPQMIFWNRSPERSSPKGAVWTTARDIFFSKPTGDKGLITGWIATLKSVTPAFVRIATPLNLKEEIENSKSNDSRQIAFELRNKLLGIFHHEKRTILGPVIKSRQEMMERVLYSKNVADEIARLSREDGVSEGRLRKKAYQYYREIAADFNIVYVSLFARAVSIMFRKIYDGITYDPEAIAMLREASQRGPLVLAPCHKSHMDYLIISYILFMNNMFPPHIAAGSNLSFFPLGVLFRHSGAFFLRRSLRGLKLYPTVFKQYIKNLVSEGYPIEFFIEGGRTRTGKLVMPKFGFLSYLMEAIEEGYNKDLIFVPIAVNYDRILEEKSYAQELKGKEKEAESVGTMVESSRLLRRKYGRVYVKFNTPFSLSEIREQGHDRKDLAGVIANTIIQRINEVTVVTPFALTTAAILLSSVKGFPRAALVQRLAALHRFLLHAGAPLSDTLHDDANIEGIVDEVIEAYRNDRILEDLRMEGSKAKEVVKDFYVLRENNRGRIVFYKNSIIHFLLPAALASTAMLAANRKGARDFASVRGELDFLTDLLSLEFLFPQWDFAGGPVPAVAREFMERESLASFENGSIAVPEDKREELGYLAKLMQDYLESYYIVIRTALEQRGRRLTRRELIVDIRRAGVSLYHTGGIALPEALSMVNYQNAVAKFSEIGVISEQHVSPKHIDITAIDRERGREYLERIRGFLDLMP